MLKKTKTININGSSVVSTENGDVTVMTMNASINENGGMNCNKYIQDKELYAKHKEEAAADFAEFESCVEMMMEV